MSKSLPVLVAFALGACGSAPVLRQVSAVSVTLVPSDASTETRRDVPTEAIGAWSTCLEKLRASDISKAIKSALAEGEYRLDVHDASGPHRLTLHNSEDLTEGGAFYKSDCAFDLVRGLGWAPSP